MSNRSSERAGMDSVRSAPTQNDLSPAPVKTKTSTRSSSLASRNASPNSRYMSRVRELSFSGRLIRTSAMPSETS